jgi:hypothetical protein
LRNIREDEIHVQGKAEVSIVDIEFLLGWVPEPGKIILLKLGVERGILDLIDRCESVLEISEVCGELFGVKQIRVSCPYATPGDVGTTRFLILTADVEIWSGYVTWWWGSGSVRGKEVARRRTGRRVVAGRTWRGRVALRRIWGMVTLRSVGRRCRPAVRKTARPFCSCPC